MNSEDELKGYILSGNTRKPILLCLDKNNALSPVEISRKIGILRVTVSKTLLEMVKSNLVKCLNPNKKSWRKYEITEKGKESLSKISLDIEYSANDKKSRSMK